MTLPQRVATILWPSFLMAGLMEGLVFSAFDPATLRFGDLAEWPPGLVYTASFLLFWLIISTSGALTALLWLEPDDAPAD